MHTALDLSFPAVGFEPTFTLTKDWADPVAGITAHYVVNDKWFINFLTDLGGLNNIATIPAWHAVLYDPGEFRHRYGPVSNAEQGLRRVLSGSALPMLARF
jgi:hypothetical protein